MASKPVKVLTDLLTKKQIIKRDFQDNLLFQVSGTIAGGHVSSSLPLTASSGYIPDLFVRTDTPFINLNITTSSNGSYEINDAFHTIDIFGNNYKRLRYQLTGNFDSEGYAEILLPKEQYGGRSFQVSSIDYIDINVMIKDGNSWTNDLIAVSIVQSGTLEDEVWVQISAPALNELNKYRLLAVNENPADYVL